MEQVLMLSPSKYEGLRADLEWTDFALLTRPYRYNRAMSKAKIRARFAALLLLLASVALPSDGLATEPYPIWWSPKLQLDSLDAIDARLARPFWDESLDPGGLPLYPEGYRQEDRREARNCVELLALRERGYFAGSNNNINLMLYFEAWCRAIANVKTARPAARSFVRDFALDRDSVNYLPALAIPGHSCYSACLLREANDRRIPLAEIDRQINITAADGRRIVMESPISRDSIEIVGLADFNQDGFEDVMVIGESISIEPSPTTLLNAIDLYILTRDEEGQVLAVVSPDQHLCPDYECTPPYDELPALRQAD